ncbi:cytochrome P450 [Xylaria sp. FL1777]|nr:cytochrome P450 [Xylaria sp. FL1777]
MFTPKPQLVSESSLDGSAPPVVHIPLEARRSSKAHAAYNAALDEHGPVIMVPRHGRNEYIIDHRYAHEILTDSKNFMFETAAFDMLHLGFLTLFRDGGFVNDIDTLIEKNVQPRMNAIIDHIFPVFQSYFDNMTDRVRTLTNDEKYVELPGVYHQLQLALAHAVVVMILGQDCASSTTASHFAAVASGVARMTGMHENTDEWVIFPKLWVLMTGFSAVLFTIIPKFFNIIPMLWRTRKQHLENGLAGRHGDFVPLFDILLTKYYYKQSGISAVLGFLRCALICVGVIFASIHQTVVACTWILVKLTQVQEEYLPAIREEWETVNPPGESLDVKKLSQLTILDSFIREVMRTKGDLFAPLRHTQREIRVGPYVLPKNAMCMILISRAHRHPDNYGTTGEVFDPLQWHKSERPAVQVTPQYLAFGLGRWACPGRQLAVHEIKIMLYMFFSHFDIKLKEGSFRVVDPINTTSIAPEATLLLRLRKELRT